MQALTNGETQTSIDNPRFGKFLLLRLTQTYIKVGLSLVFSQQNRNWSEPSRSPICTLEGLSTKKKHYPKKKKNIPLSIFLPLNKLAAFLRDPYGLKTLLRTWRPSHPSPPVWNIPEKCLASAENRPKSLVTGQREGSPHYEGFGDWYVVVLLVWKCWVLGIPWFKVKRLLDVKSLKYFLESSKVLRGGKSHTKRESRKANDFTTIPSRGCFLCLTCWICKVGLNILGVIWRTKASYCVFSEEIWFWIEVFGIDHAQPSKENNSKMNKSGRENDQIEEQKSLPMNHHSFTCSSKFWTKQQNL